jgi:hypothetical protein
MVNSQGNSLSVVPNRKKNTYFLGAFWHSRQFGIVVVITRRDNDFAKLDFFGQY